MQEINSPDQDWDGMIKLEEGTGQSGVMEGTAVKGLHWAQPQDSILKEVWGRKQA